MERVALPVGVLALTLAVFLVLRLDRVLLGVEIRDAQKAPNDLECAAPTEELRVTRGGDDLEDALLVLDGLREVGAPLGLNLRGA